MIKLFYKNIVNRLLCLLLILIFLSSFSTGAAALTFCLESAETHVVALDHFQLTGCHVPFEVGAVLLNNYHTVPAEQKSDNCIDISSSAADSLIRPSDKILPVFAKVILPASLIDIISEPQGKKPDKMSAVLKQPKLPTTAVYASRTVVLLI